jgi:hypothetical protein
VGAERFYESVILRGNEIFNMKKSVILALFLFSLSSLKAENLYRVYFSSKGTGPTNVEIEALNDAGAREQVKARYPGAYSIVVIQIPAKKEPK